MKCAEDFQVSKLTKRIIFQLYSQAKSVAIQRSLTIFADKNNLHFHIHSPIRFLKLAERFMCL
jgi:hypothetical protein